MSKRSRYRRPARPLIVFRAEEIYKNRQRSGVGGSPEADWMQAVSELSHSGLQAWVRLKLIAQNVWRWGGLADKKGWDFVQILIVPLTLAYATYIFQEAAKRRDAVALEATKHKEAQAAKDKDQATVLSRYFLEMQSLIKDGLVKKTAGDPEFIIGQTKTVLALQQLDPNRQRLVIQFMEASKLNEIDENGLLYRAQMSGSSLQRANLSGIKMIEANLSGAMLQGAKLAKADMTGSNLQQANLSETDLTAANLTNATLIGSGLFRAILSCATLDGADLSWTYLNGARLYPSDDRFSGCGDGINPSQQLASAKLVAATYNTKLTNLITLGSWTIESNWLMQLASELPFVNVDGDQVKESPTAFPPGFDPKPMKMKEMNGVVKVREGGINW